MLGVINWGRNGQILTKANKLHRTSLVPNYSAKFHQNCEKCEVGEWTDGNDRCEL